MCQLLQHSRCFPSRMDCNSGEWDVMGDRHLPAPSGGASMFEEDFVWFARLVFLDGESL